MDVGYRKSSSNFSLRAAALIIHDGKLLLAKSNDYDCYYTVGGKIHQNESSEDAVLRECYEETGEALTIERLVFVQERFFSLENIDYHEVVFFYLMQNINPDLCNGMNTDQKNEHLYWMPISELEGINLVPTFQTMAVKSIRTKSYIFYRMNKCDLH